MPRTSISLLGGCFLAAAGLLAAAATEPPTTPARRGAIVDREHRVLATSQPSGEATPDRHATRIRWYPNGRTAAHVLGAVRSTAGDTGEVRLAGISGIERQYDDRLRERPGSDGRMLPGDDVVLSLDLDLQRAAERAMDATPGRPRGAAVALAVATGEVLALVSQPDYDANDVSPVLSRAAKDRIDDDGAWFNRAVQGLYPPGSTFKIFTVLAGLRHGTLHPEDTLHCPGFYDVGGRRFPCHQPAGHGDLSLRTALAQSCNVYAYQVGLAAGPDAVAAEARRFHFAEPSGIDLPGETQKMLVPDPAWAVSTGRGPWTKGDTINLAIGQGYLRYSPLQAACAIASLARRETRTVPTLLLQPGRRASGPFPPEPLALSDRDYAAVMEGLRAVIETGIGKDAQVPGVRLAGKTGTAQIRRSDGTVNVAWFVAFAPVERPEIAIAVAMEGDTPGVEFAGGKYAAPIVREIAAAYFTKHGR